VLKRSRGNPFSVFRAELVRRFSRWALGRHGKLCISVIAGAIYCGRSSFHNITIRKDRQNFIDNKHSRL
jgi:hypothetical protein